MESAIFSIELAETLQEIERLDIENTFRLGTSGNFLEVFGIAIETTKASINLLKTTTENLECPMTPEEEYFIQETLAVLHRLLCTGLYPVGCEVTIRNSIEIVTALRDFEPCNADHIRIGDKAEHSGSDVWINGDLYIVERARSTQ